MEYLDWWKSLTTEQRYDFDAQGRAYKKDARTMMRLAWDAAAVAEREACADEAEKHMEGWAAARAIRMRSNVNTVQIEQFR